MKPEKTTQAIAAARRELIGRNVRTSYRNPLHIVRASMQYLFDETGRRYVDGYNNVPHVGHCHPAVIEQAARQSSILNTNTRYLHESLEAFAASLTVTLPAPLQVCYFVNSGSEANELALRLARAHTSARDLIVLEAAYHGNTTTLIDISPYKADGPGGTGHASWVHVVPIADVYRGEHRAGDSDAGAKYAASVADEIGRLRAAGGRFCGFIAESCPSVGGQIIFPPGYLAEVYRHVRAAGGVCIADEVQTAYGRLGHSFYAFEEQRVVPDIVVLGKPIGNGFPLGAVVRQWHGILQHVRGQHRVVHRGRHGAADRVAGPLAAARSGRGRSVAGEIEFAAEPARTGGRRTRFRPLHRNRARDRSRDALAGDTGG
jgi:4-aminobutyrate aminotransferase-like enzyme